MDASRLERAARALVDRMDEMFVGPATRARIEELRAALAAQPEAEPVLWFVRDDNGLDYDWTRSATKQHVQDVVDGWNAVKPQMSGAPFRLACLYSEPKSTYHHAGSASAEAVARAVREAALVNYNTPQEYDVACAQRAACEMAALNCIDAMRPGGAS